MTRSNIGNLQFLNLINTCGGIRHAYKNIKHKHPHIWWQLEEYKKKLDFVPSFAELAYCAMNGIVARPLCITCEKNQVSFKGFSKGYAIFCGPSCVGKHDAIKGQRKKTLKEKYGVTSPVQIRWDK
jgi:hypothetical protein